MGKRQDHASTYFERANKREDGAPIIAGLAIIVLVALSLVHWLATPR